MFVYRDAFYSNSFITDDFTVHVSFTQISDELALSFAWYDTEQKEIALIAQTVLR